MAVAEGFAVAAAVPVAVRAVGIIAANGEDAAVRTAIARRVAASVAPRSGAAVERAHATHGWHHEGRGRVSGSEAEEEWVHS